MMKELYVTMEETTGVRRWVLHFLLKSNYMFTTTVADVAIARAKARCAKTRRPIYVLKCIGVAHIPIPKVTWKPIPANKGKTRRGR
jgi:hypothetical protein